LTIAEKGVLFPLLVSSSRTKCVISRSKTLGVLTFLANSLLFVLLVEQSALISRWVLLLSGSHRALHLTLLSLCSRVALAEDHSLSGLCCRMDRTHSEHSAIGHEQDVTRYWPAQWCFYRSLGSNLQFFLLLRELEPNCLLPRSAH